MAHRLFDDPATVRHAFCTVIRVVLLALFFAALLLSIANDMYAFFKARGEVLLVLDEPCSLSVLSLRLEALGVLRNPHVFSLYVRAKGRTALVESLSGELALDRGMSYREILACLVAGVHDEENFSLITE